MESNKIKLLILWDILCKYTDEEHAMNTDEIIAALKEKGISVIRKVVAEDIKTLNDYGYEVLSYKRRYHYYYVVNRPFDIAEIVMLTDVVKSSKLTDNMIIYIYIIDYIYLYNNERFFYKKETTLLEKYSNKVVCGTP